MLWKNDHTVNLKMNEAFTTFIQLRPGSHRANKKQIELNLTMILIMTFHSSKKPNKGYW